MFGHVNAGTRSRVKGNRLIRVEPAKDPNDLVQGDRKLEFRYDYMGRRVEKRVYTHNGTSWDLSTTRRFMYYNWLPLLELDATNPGHPNETITILRKYTWGLDLAGGPRPLAGASSERNAG